MKTFRSVALAIVLVMIPTVLLCQSPNAAIAGRITDPTKGTVPHAKVEVINTATNLRYETETDDAGSYVVANLSPGSYRIEVEKQGFKSVVKPDLILHVQDTVEINFEMVLGSSTETVTVSAGGINMNTTDGTVSTVIDRQFVANIPLNGRSLQSLISLTPGVLVVNSGVGSPGTGVNGEFSVNGQRTESNYFTVDGVSANTGSSPTYVGGAGNGGNVPALSALGTTQSMISLDALEEFRASTSTYSAEYGRTPGGQFSFVSRSGTNSWHGSAFDYFRNDVLDANGWFNNATGLPRTPERQNDFGGTLGGPIRIPGIYNGKDKTFFFFSYEGLRLRQPQGAVTDQYPDSAMRQNAPSALQPFLNSFPVPNGPEVLNANGQPIGLAYFTSAYSAPGSLDSLSIRVDHSVTERMKVFGRYSWTPSSSTTRLAGNDLANSTNASVDVQTVTLGATNTLSPALTNDFRINYTRNNQTVAYTLDNFGGAQPFDIRQVPGFGGSGAPKFSALTLFLNFGSTPHFNVQPEQDSQQQWNLTDIFSASHGLHSFKFGIDYRRLSTILRFPQLSEVAVFASQSQVLMNAPAVLSASGGINGTPQPIFTNFSAFFQDEWKVTRRLSVSLGLRWDLNPPPGNGNGVLPYTLNQITDLTTAQLAPPGTPLWQTDHHAFAPRVGAAYLLQQSSGRETVLRGGFGIFYDVGNILGSYGFGGVGFLSGTAFANGDPFPMTSAQLVIPPASITPPYNATVFAFDPYLTLPYTMQWNLALQQALGHHESLTLTYVGSAGRNLLHTDILYASQNPNFGSRTSLSLIRGGATSDYDALQVQFQKQLSHGLQSLVSYTFSHSIDDRSTNFNSYSQLLRGNSDFDVRHNFQMALTYDLPGRYSNILASQILGHWGVDTRVTARSALPVNVLGPFSIQPDGQLISFQPDLVPGVPIYLYGAQYPGGRILNFGAFQAAPTNTQGNLPRNFARGFNAVQADLALRRDFPIKERLHLQFRAEAFNVFNHPTFGNINNTLRSGPYNPQTLSGFGAAQSTLNNSLGVLSPLYQIGGPRSMQVSLKLQF